MSALRPTLLLGATLLAACATSMPKRTADTLQYADYAGAPIESFHIVNLDGWQSVGRYQLLVWNGPSEAYLITVWKSCRNLQFANVVNISSTSREVSRLEQVTVDDMKCPIDEIRPVDVAKLRADRRAREEAAPAPAP